MNVYAEEVMDLAMVEEEVKKMEGTESDAEDEIKITISYLVHMVIHFILETKIYDKGQYQSLF